MKTSQKVYVDEIRYQRVFDQARPPLDRLAESGIILANVHLERLLTIRNKVDTLALRERLETNINKLWNVKTPINEIPVNIFDTLRKEKDNPLVTLSFEPSILVQ